MWSGDHGTQETDLKCDGNILLRDLNSNGRAMIVVVNPANSARVFQQAQTDLPV